MRKITLLIFIVILIFALSFAITLGAEIDKAKRRDYLKKIFNMIFEENNNNDKITRDEAFRIAEQITHGLAAKAKNVTLSHEFLTFNGIKPAALTQKAKDANPKLKNGINKLPVWIVTYEGVNLPGKFNTVITEDNIVIDATTGEFLFGFKH